MRSIGLAVLIFAIVETGVARDLPDGQRSSYPLIETALRIGATIKTGEFYRVETKKLRPTQFSVGREQVEKKKRELLKYSRAELEAYLKRRIGSAVIGPGGQIWLVDGHHIATALHELGLGPLIIEVREDWSDLPVKEFFARMERERLLWMKDRNGRTRSFQDLPRSLDGLENDPYRTLAWKVLKRGGVIETSVPFQEFIWADYYRKQISLDLMLSKPDIALLKAVELSGRREVSHLPGYIGQDARCVLRRLEQTIQSTR